VVRASVVRASSLGDKLMIHVTMSCSSQKQMFLKSNHARFNHRRCPNKSMETWPADPK